MDRPGLGSPVRRYIAYISSLGTTQLHLRNPFVIALLVRRLSRLRTLIVIEILKGISVVYLGTICKREWTY
ncbi:MAG TPA: hypothetical protein VIM51_05155 [Desulfosporosinus sp.]